MKGMDTMLARSLTGHSSERVFERYIQGKRLAAAEDAFFRAVGEQKATISSRTDNRKQSPPEPSALNPTVLEAEYEVVQELSFEPQVASPDV